MCCPSIWMKVARLHLKKVPCSPNSPTDRLPTSVCPGRGPPNPTVTAIDAGRLATAWTPTPRTPYAVSTSYWCSANWPAAAPTQPDRQRRLQWQQKATLAPSSKHGQRCLTMRRCACWTSPRRVTSAARGSNWRAWRTPGVQCQRRARPGRWGNPRRLYRLLAAASRRGAGAGLDVGHGQLHARLRHRPRVLCIAGVNAAMQASGHVPPCGTGQCRCWCWTCLSSRRPCCGPRCCPGSQGR